MKSMELYALEIKSILTKHVSILMSCKDLSSVEVEEIVKEVNKLIKQNKEISTRYMSREEAENAVGMIKTAINLLPTTIQEIRIVTIENLDEQACGGTHVKNTNEIGTLVIDKSKK